MPDASETLVYDFNGSLWTAPVGTELPTYAEFYPVSPATFVPAVPWVNTGFLTEDGPAFESKDDQASLRAWQSRAVVRQVSKGKATTLGFNLLEWSIDNVIFALGLVDDGTGLLIPSAAAVERAVLVVVTDGDTAVGIGFTRGSLAMDAKIAFKPADWATLPVSLTALQPDGGGPEFQLYLPAAA